VALACALSFAALAAPSGASAALIGEVTEFTTGITPNSLPARIAAGPEGDLWFTEHNEFESTNIGRITPAGEVTQFPILDFSEPLGIVAGPDGNLWFTEVNNPECHETCRSYVGRITPSGEYKGFWMGIDPGSQPWEISNGPDGNLWFTELQSAVSRASDNVARITPSGTVTQFRLTGEQNRAPWGIAAGSNGDLWFTEWSADTIGRINPTTHEITEFPIPTPESEPEGITAGPEGNMWFTETSARKIGRITPTGAITEFPADVEPYGGGEPNQITAGPDGNLWFSTDDGVIGRMTPSGALTECAIPAGHGQLEGLTAGPGGIWFTDYYESRIGRITATGSALASNCTGAPPSPTPTPTPTPTPIASAPAPNSAFSSASAKVNATTGAITFTETVTQPGTFSWLLTFQNGKFGVFAAKSTKCKKGFIKLNGKCRPSKITFGKGRETLAAAGSATFTVKPSASASKALKEALKHKKGLPVAVTITFQSVRGGAAVTHAQSLTVKLKRK
jgi:streptogramin lyase